MTDQTRKEKCRHERHVIVFAHCSPLEMNVAGQTARSSGNESELGVENEVCHRNPSMSTYDLFQCQIPRLQIKILGDHPKPANGDHLKSGQRIH